MEHKPAEWADRGTKVTIWKCIRKKDPQPDIFNIIKKGRIYQKLTQEVKASNFKINLTKMKAKN